MFKLIDCKIQSDVPALGVRSVASEVQVEVQDSDTSKHGLPLITARLAPSDAVRLARALLTAAGVHGVTLGNGAQRYTFID